MSLIAQDLLHAMLQSLSRTDTAWTTASTAGAPHVQSLSNAVLTFADLSVSPSASPPALDQLSSLHNSATESLSWIRTTLTRLTAALRGARQTEQNISNASTTKSPSRTLASTAFPDSLHTQQRLHTWHARVKHINDGFERDLRDKRHILQVLEHATKGAYVSKHKLELAVALWLEQPERVAGEASVLVAAYEAEKAAAEHDLASPVSSPGVTRRSSSGARAERAESPALALLRQSGKKKGG